MQTNKQTQKENRVNNRVKHNRAKHNERSIIKVFNSIQFQH